VISIIAAAVAGWSTRWSKRLQQMSCGTKLSHHGNAFADLARLYWQVVARMRSGAPEAHPQTSDSEVPKARSAWLSTSASRARGSNATEVQFHYDVSNDFFKLSCRAVGEHLGHVGAPKVFCSTPMRSM
jgi:hypothetical protein